MADGFEVDAEQIRTHARNLDLLRGRFDAVKTASAHIAQDDSAYGLLCGWISAVLEGRHKRQDELIAYVEENLSLVAKGLRTTADNYDNADLDADDTIRKAGGGLTRSAQ
ncbi:type VII secretion target [Micromonospora soli]|uniref:type VII secretion target n=1 Tax=Micromonospora sp. NBRC 110009 TaxID=3061627 RepID=UPI0026731AE0|nr:type VII secretion target [Micromonospora sp. NBRC 110009]WKU01167.1 type VII secretion target [Micromonospora sp. NBRC 110009]